VTGAALGWALAAAALVAGWFSYGWRGLVLALTVIAFWLLLQFSRTLRVLRSAAGRPVGHVDSTLMLHARLRTGMRLPEIISLTRSLGRKERDQPETFAWSDAGGDQVVVEFAAGRATRWELRRNPAPPPVG
jgi:hypothetical protein